MIKAVMEQDPFLDNTGEVQLCLNNQGLGSISQFSARPGGAAKSNEMAMEFNRGEITIRV